MPGTVPSLKRIHVSETENIINCIKENGCLIIKNFTTPEVVDQINAETRPYLDKDKPWKGDLFPPETRRCPRLVARSKAFRENLLVAPIVSALTAEFVDKTTSNFYGETQHTYTSKAIMSISTTMEIGPGGKAQRLHRDDKNYHVDHKDQTQTGYQKHSDVELSFLIPGIDTTIENGATQVIPGSHLWDNNRVPLFEEVDYAVMNKGDAYVMLGSTYHAGGANQTTDTKRPMHGMFFCRGYMRSEENQYLIHSPEEVMSWSPEAQRIMGYTVSAPNIGFVDFIDPGKYLSGDYDPDNLHDFDPSQEVKPWNVK
ncbi:hypothetical protein AAFC00_001873 [Neodothiora populina]|uniref:Phytanoyl-CoA dioxygenase n=1 Tax=Neodothiora populina TaxID=2781224 RepID=A0ABR3PQF6_9PEZI